MTLVNALKKIINLQAQVMSLREENELLAIENESLITELESLPVPGSYDPTLEIRDRSTVAVEHVKSLKRENDQLNHTVTLMIEALGKLGYKIHDVR